MYKINTVTGNIILGNQIIPQDDSSPLYQDYNQWLRAGNRPIETTELLPEESRFIDMIQTKAKYEIHRKNGWNAYQDFRARIVQDIKEGLLTELQAFVIEDDLKIAYDRIAQNGDWKTALYGLSQVTPSAPFVEPYLTLAIEYITDYINKNYEA
jgi:hypothetical protein